MRHSVKKVLEVSQTQNFFFLIYVPLLYLHISINYFVKFTTYKHLVSVNCLCLKLIAD